MLKKFNLKLKRRETQQTRNVTYPCAWCGTWAKPEEMRVVGLNDRKVHICKVHTA